MHDETDAALRRALHHSLQYLGKLDETPVGATVSLETLRARIMKPLGNAPVAATQVIDELVADSEGGIVGCAGGRFYAWVVGGALPASLAADWLTSAWDQNAGIYASGQAAAITEEASAAWLKELLGIPSAASFAMVTGCQMAHVTCLAAARYAVLKAKGWDVNEKGLAGGPAVRVLAGEFRHGSTARALRLLGLAKSQSVELKPGALELELSREPGRPTILMLQAGELNTGAYDRFTELIPIAKKHGAWVHIDGAFGLWAAASPSLRHLTAGCELADSWATDGHKWLNVPYDSGYAFVRDTVAHQASMSYRASYLIHDTEARDQMDWNPEWSRRARGFATYAALRELGRSGVADLVDRCCAHATALVRGIGALPGAEIVCDPLINQGLVRFIDPAGVDDDAWTNVVIAKVMASGEAFFGGCLWQGKRCMRISVCNWRTTQEDVERVIQAFNRILSE